MQANPPDGLTCSNPFLINDRHSRPGTTMDIVGLPNITKTCS
jgi:hypothetical protein